MVKPEKFGHPHLVYHFTVPLIVTENIFVYKLFLSVNISDLLLLLLLLFCFVFL